MGREKRHIPLWNTEYPPLPQPANLDRAATETHPPSADEELTQRTKIGSNSFTVICKDGDLLIKVRDLRGASHQWQVSSKAISNNSAYFRALLDPDKFVEGRDLAAHRQELAQRSTNPHMSDPQNDNLGTPMTPNLPTLKISDPMAKLCGLDAIEVFLKILCLGTQDEETKRAFEVELRDMAIPTAAHALEIAERWNSCKIVAEAFNRVKYTFGRTRLPLRKFSRMSTAKWTEERMRQAIAIALALEIPVVAQALMHGMIVLGSKYWGNGPELPNEPFHTWRYLPQELEEELYYRRQCVINTMTDLQAYFLRQYGALEEVPDTRPFATGPTILGASFSTTPPSSTFQCRAGLGNGSQCDMFQLGQMTRFFAMRSKTIFIGSTMLDPDFSLDEPREGEEDVLPDDPLSQIPATALTPSQGHSSFPTESPTPSNPPSDLAAVILLLKRFPDYQVDPHHQACGIRRRFIPTLKCIEKYVIDERGLLGIDMDRWKQPTERSEMSWRTSIRHPMVDIRFDQIRMVSFAPAPMPGQASLEYDAQTLFTAKVRNWESREI